MSLFLGLLARNARTGSRSRLSHPSARTFSTTNMSDGQRLFKSDAAAKGAERPGFYPVYVHHISKIALEHLQGVQADWVVEQGLDSGLTINSNGTFLLTFPTVQGRETGRIW
jgi:hypothetical protein